jgi:hypothetical protein|tara:strand:- start:295 stop:525 length:231 start_codon:yes stop_codon:yes gene_type:complete
MSKIKQYIETSVEKQVDKITNDYLEGNIDLNTAENKIENIDNIEMVVEKHNIGDHLFYAKEEAKEEQENKMKAKYL